MMDNNVKKELFLQAWKEALGVSAAGDEDNFFELGGDSLKGAQLVGLLMQKGLKLDLLKIYTEPTVSQLVAALEETEPVSMPEMLSKAPAFPHAPVSQPQTPVAAPAPEQWMPQPMAVPQWGYAPQPMYGQAIPYMLVPVYVLQPMFAPQMMAPHPFAASAGYPPFMGMPAQPYAAPQAYSPGAASKSAEDALDTALREIFPNGYDKQVNLFEQGLDSLKMMQLSTRCGEFGYQIELPDIMKDPTFVGILSSMKTGAAPTAPAFPASQPRPVTRSAESALEAALREIFPNGYDKQVNLFEQGLDSMKMMMMTTRCGEFGYQIELPDIMKDPTFNGILSAMKPGAAAGAPAFQPTPIGPVTKSPEDALDAALREIFPGGYDKQVNLFEQGFDSLKMMELTTRCAEYGYQIDMPNIMKDPTFEGIVSAMKTE